MRDSSKEIGEEKKLLRPKSSRKDGAENQPTDWVGHSDNSHEVADQRRGRVSDPGA